MSIYKPKPSQQFEKDLRKCVQNPKWSLSEFLIVSNALSSGLQLEQKYKVHPLKGQWVNHKGCHVCNDMVVIFRIDQTNMQLLLVRIGTHHELFGC